MTDRPAESVPTTTLRWSRHSPLDVGFLLATVALLGDQASKLAVEVAMNPPRTIPVTPYFNLVLNFNYSRGISFGFLSSGPVADAGTWALILLSTAIVAGLSVWLARTTDPKEAGAMGAIIGGAIGNILDRLSLDHVTDFLDFHVGGWHWPAFNLADTFISCGVAVLMLRSFVSSRKGG